MLVVQAAASVTLSNDKTPCNHCRIAGRKCVRGYNIRFRNLVSPENNPSRKGGKYEFYFDDDQEWPPFDNKIEFVDDEDVAPYIDTPNNNTNTADGSTVSSPPTKAFSRQEKTVDLQHLTPNGPSTEDYNTPTTDSSISHSIPVASLLQGDDYSHTYNLSNSPYLLRQATKNKVTSEATNAAFLGFQATPAKMRPKPDPPPPQPLESLEEAKLLHHFVAYLAPWFDVTDTKRHFATVAPCLARNSPVLMNAILGISALNLSKTANHNPLDAVEYHDRCIDAMVPLLNDEEQIKDDSLLMTSMILALHEDLINGADSNTHITGTSLFLPLTTLSSRLRRAVFWCHLRQEIYASCCQQRPVRIDMERIPLEPSFEPADDEIWAHRAIWICGRVVQWAFGEESTPSGWRDLNQLVVEWERLRPESFDPIFFEERNPAQGRWFPDACHLTDDHVAGNQFLLIAKLLLTTHDPTIPKIGYKMRSATKKMQETVRGYVRLLCGIGLRNTFVPGCFYGMLAVRICGNLFEDKAEQGQLLLLLKLTEEKSGWPKRKAEMVLKEEWGWDD